MKAIAATALFLAALSPNVLYCRAADEEPQSAFFADKETAIRQEYLECTGDDQPVELKFVIGWKQRMEAWKQTQEYAELLKEYKKAVSGAQTVHPCKLLDWNKRRKQTQDSAEKSLVKRILSDNEADDAAEELKAHPASHFDIAGIPFGVSKTVFRYLFKKKYADSLEEKNAFFYAEDFSWNGAAFMTAFFFNDDNRFYKYEAESDALPARQLNGPVRTAAGLLTKTLEQSLGPPVRSCRIGLYDIKSREIAVAGAWADSVSSAVVGFSVLDYRYYAKAIVVNATFSPKAAKFPHQR